MSRNTGIGKLASQRVSRRQLLKSGSLGAAGLALGGCNGGSDGISARQLQPDSGQSTVNKLPGFEFTEQERATLSAAVARIVPAGGPGDWSAADAGAVEYIEQLLNGFSLPGAPRIYGGGPFREDFGEFLPLSRVKTLGWQTEVLRLRRVYREGLAELDRRARGPLALIPGSFSALPELLQDSILTEQDLAATAFFAALYAHTLEGVYAHPVYGGNREYIAWKEFCYQGDVHGVRFPSGQQDPAADDRPWDKFGGYSPQEMVGPGQCPGQGPEETS